MLYTVGYPLIIPHPSPSPLNSYVRAPPPDLMANFAPFISALSPQFSDSSRPSWVGVGLQRSWRFLVTGGVKEAEGWRPSEREGYRGQNLAAPLSQDVKVGQSVPWMISNSTFWGPIHWKYIYTHALSYIGREWVSEREIDKKMETWVWVELTVR